MKSPAQLRRITGSSQGIGREIAVECAKHGARLVLHHLGDAQASQDIKTLMGELNAATEQPETVTVAVDVGIDVTETEAGQRCANIHAYNGLKTRSLLTEPLL